MACATRKKKSFIPFSYVLPSLVGLGLVLLPLRSHQRKILSTSMNRCQTHTHHHSISPKPKEDPKIGLDTCQKNARKPTHHNAQNFSCVYLRKTTQLVGKGGGVKIRGIIKVRDFKNLKSIELDFADPFYERKCIKKYKKRVPYNLSQV